MRIPLARAVPLLLGFACGLLVGCSGPYAGGRLAPKGVPRISDTDTDVAPRPATQNNEPIEPDAVVTSMPKVSAARILEADVISFVKSLHAQYGRAGLIAVKPGETLIDRLRYCTSRVMLERTKEVLPELERLAVDHPENPVVWRQLGWGKYWANDRDGADRCMRKAFELARRDGFATCPALPSFLGKLLLERSETQEEGVRLLRNELAEGQDYRRACWTLAAYFSRREQHIDALSCLDAAMERKPADQEFILGKAQVLLDIHRSEDVLKVLEPLLRKTPPDRYAIDTMLRARVLRKEFDEALALMDQLLSRTEVTPAERKDLQARREGLVEAKKVGFKKRLLDWEVYAVLRGHPDLRERRHMLRQVVEQDNVRVREHSLRIAFNSESPVLRAEALILLMPQSTQPLVNVRAGLKDHDGKVRGTAAILAAAAKTDRDKLAGLLLEFMVNESDAYAFRQMHTALGRLTGAKIELPIGAAEDPEQRRGVLEQWQKAAEGRKGK